MARQKAKTKWIKEGDENSKFFHMACQNREIKNSIHGLSIDAEWTEEPEVIKKYVFEFFKQKYAKKKDFVPKLSMHRLNKLMVEEEKSTEGKFSEKEVWEAINSCGNNKSPGPDGFTIEFVRRFWSIIVTPPVLRG